MDSLEDIDYWETNDNFDKRASVTSRGGRPYLYSPKEISELMIRYFRNCIDHYQPITITGLCLQLGISREGMRKMEKSSSKELGDIIKKGRQIVEAYYEYLLLSLPNPSFAIFVLKNMGWSDKMEIKSRSSASGALTEEDREEMKRRIRNFSENPSKI
jgi:hypothetical protein